MKKPRRDKTLPAARAEQSPTVQHTILATGWSGPLPPPEALEAFERIVPGGAAKIFDQFESEANHRRTLEDRRSRFVIRDVHIGQILAGLFSLSGLGVAAFAIWLDKPWAATIIGGGTIAPIVYAFLRQARAKKPD